MPTMATYDVFARFYDALTADINYTARAAYFDGLLRPHIGEGARVLDLACGTGGLSIPLSRLGYDVIAVDRSPEMLALAMQKTAESELSVLFLNQDMTALDLYGDIDGAICALDSLNHLPDRKAFEKALGRVALFLRPGGVFAFDLNTPYKHSHILADHAYIFDTKEVYCVWQNRTQGLFTRIALDFFVPEDGVYTRYSERFTERAFTQSEIETAIAQAGLSLLHVYEADSLLPPKPESERLVYLTKKV